jgi:hypothetical protein
MAIPRKPDVGDDVGERDSNERHCNCEDKNYTSLFVQTTAVLRTAADFTSANQTRPPSSAATSPPVVAVEANP